MDGQRTELSIKRRINPDNRDANSQRARGRSEKARLLSNYIDEIENEINRHYNIALREKQSITAEMLKDKVTGADKQKKMLVPVFEEYCNLIEQEKGRKYTERTINRYTHALEHIKGFLKKVINKSDR